MKTLRVAWLSLALLGCHHGKSTSDAGSKPDAAIATGDGAVAAPDGGGADLGIVTGQSVLQRGNDLARRATFAQAGLTKAAAATMAADTTFDSNATFPANGNTTGQGMASVLYLEQGPAAAGCPTGVPGCPAPDRPAGAGVFFAFAPLGSNPNVFAFDETSGKPVWTATVTPGNDGIRGTPVIDPVSRRIFLVTGPNPHMVRALSVDTGAEITTGGWPVTLSSTTLSYNGNAFASNVQNQHGALLFMNNILYVPFGGENGDGGNYYGWIVAIDTTNPSSFAGWATQSVKSGMWAAGGLASDGTYVIGTTGNTSGIPRASSDSEELVRVKGLAEFSRDANSIFVPTEWQAWDNGDLDFSSASPAFVPLPAGSSPASLVVAPGKGGRVFILDGTNLSGGTYPTPGGHLADIAVSDTAAFSIYTSPTIYTSASGIHATINVGGSASSNTAYCPTGTTATNEEYISMVLTPGAAGSVVSKGWCAGNSSGGGTSNHPPISTTSDGVSADAMVWFMDGGQLTAVDGDTGTKVVTTSGTTCDSIFSMSFPIAAKNRIVVAALGHLCSWSPNGQ